MLRFLSLVLLCILSAMGNAARAATPGAGDLDQVMGLLAMGQHGRGEFIEQHFLAVLKRPIESSGELRYDAPDRLEKGTLKPLARNLVLTGGELAVGGHHGRAGMSFPR